MKTVRDTPDLKDKKILVRTDFDVPVENGKIRQSLRVQKQKPLIDQLVLAGSKVLLVAHISAIDSFSVIFGELEQLLGRKIIFIKTPEDIAGFLAGSKPLGLLENTRTWPGEKDNDQSLAQRLAQGFDFYINNDFAVCHREHASVVAITKLLSVYAGPLIVEEVKQLKRALTEPVQDKIVIMGGAKASTKVPVIKSFLRNAQAVLVGGIIANDILKARGQDVQQSIVDDDAEKLLAGVDLTDKRLWVPSDFVIDDGKFLDIGAESIGRFIGEIRTAKMIIWNGPMGMFEKDKFMVGTKAIAEAIVNSSAFSIIGGGDTISAVDQLGLLGKFSFVSTGGGAMLMFLGNQKLPGLDALGYYE